MKLKQSIRLAVMTFVILSGTFYPALAGPTADEIMETVDARDDGDTATADFLMVLMDKKKNKRIRNIKSIRKDFGEDSKGILFFLSPADVRNTAYMSYDWDDYEKEDDSWLYLPALARVKRVAAGDKSNAFMGSDFSYSDINGIEIRDWVYAFAKESVILDGKDTWVIQGIPRVDAKDRVLEETGYLKSLTWVRKDNFVVVKAKYWVKEGRKIKFFKAEDIQIIDNVWTAKKLTMVTTSKGKIDHSSVLKLSNVKYNTPVKDSYFTTRSMEQGL